MKEEGRKEGKEQGRDRVLGEKGELKRGRTDKKREEECQDEETGGKRKERPKRECEIGGSLRRADELISSCLF